MLMMGRFGLLVSDLSPFLVSTTFYYGDGWLSVFVYVSLTDNMQLVLPTAWILLACIYARNGLVWGPRY